MGKRPVSKKFTRVPDNVNKICDEMNYANDNFDSWIPTTNAEIRLKEVIEKIEKRIKK